MTNLLCPASGARKTAIFSILAAWSAAAVLAAGGAAAQTVGTAIEDEPAAAELTSSGDTLQLSLDEAVEIALRRNLALIAQRYDLARSDSAYRQNLGIYDLNLRGDYQFSDSSSPAGSALEGADVVESEVQTFGFTFDQLTPYGGTASLNWNNSRNFSNNSFFNFNPQYSADSTLTFTQPLLRDFGKLPTERGLLLARRDQSLSEETFEQQVISTVEQVENAYWNLVQSRKQLEVSRESLALARELHDRNRIKVEVGTLAPFELVQSEAGIASRDGDIIRDEATVGDAEDRLRQLLNLEDGPLWEMPIVPQTEPVVEDPDIDLAEAIRTALAERSEVFSKQLELDRLEIDSRYFRNQKKPRVDFSLSYSSNATDGVVTNPDTGAVERDGDLGDAIDTLTSLEFTGWSARVDFVVPIQNRSARAASVSADLNLRQAEVEMDDLEQQIATEVRSAVRQLKAAAQAVKAAEAARRSEEKSLEAERKRFENGMSTSFQVLQIQERLSAAQSSEVQAVSNYRTRLLDYYRSIGRLLEQKGIEIASGGG